MHSRHSTPARVLFVYEYGQAKSDWMLDSLIEQLTARQPDIRASRQHGLYRNYHPGGAHPKRLLNLAWVYLGVAARLLFFPPDSVLVRTTPPGVQLWTVWWAGWRRIPVFCWLMDYHPEMEARQLERRGFRRTARLLQRLDSWLMPRFAGIVTLDRAMADFARGRARKVEIWQHPTWSTVGAASFHPVSYSPGRGAGPLRLAYSGNLGAAHDLFDLRRLLAELQARRPVELYVIGTSAGGTARFQTLAGELEIAVAFHERVPFDRLRDLYEAWRIDAGIVLLATESAGLVSPSKFVGYINFGVPLIYSGPLGTNTAEVCTRFRGGFWLPEKAHDRMVAAVAAKLLDAAEMSLAAVGAAEAAAYFSARNADSLAQILAPRLSSGSLVRPADRPPFPDKSESGLEVRGEVSPPA